MIEDRDRMSNMTFLFFIYIIWNLNNKIKPVEVNIVYNIHYNNYYLKFNNLNMMK